MHTPQTIRKRLQTVKILLGRGADVNFMTPKLKMTPLHWAAYQGDTELLKLLLDNGAIMVETSLGSSPIDIAGFCGKKNIVNEFADYLAVKINAEADL